MMYLKSNDVEVVKQLAVPETLFLLDYVRPDLLLLRVLCRSLVMWDSVLPNAEWIESHVPLMLRACMERLRHAAPPLPGLESETSSDSDSDSQEDGAGSSNVVEVELPAAADQVRVLPAACSAVACSFHRDIDSTPPSLSRLTALRSSSSSSSLSRRAPSRW